ncbi:unnamed protein product [Sphagnum balticum]
MQLAHEVATRAHRTIQNWNNKLRLKEIEAALQQREQEAPDENFEDDGLSLDRVTAIYAKKLSHILHVCTSYREAAVVSVGESMNVRAGGRCVGLKRRFLRRAMLRRKLLVNKAIGEKWAKGDRKHRKDALPESTVVVVVSWWTDETRVSPNKKDVTQFIARNVREMHAKHYLQESEVDFFTRFKVAHEDVQIGPKSFVKLKPYFVKRLKDFNTCCCKYHQEMVKIKDGFNMRSTDDHHPSCSCQCDSICTRPVNNYLAQVIVTCQGIHHIFKRSMDLWSQSLCPTPLVQWMATDFLSSTIHVLTNLDQGG